MRLEDLKVEVRNSSNQKVGTITRQWLNLVAKPKLRGVGTWEVVLPKGHPMAAELATPGSGLIVSLYGTEHLSGPTDHPKSFINQTNPDGTYTFTGVTDTVLLADALAAPDPSTGDLTAQTQTNDVRTGDAESLMRAYVAANLVPGVAPAERVAGLRSYLRLETINGNRGPVMRKSPRFQNLGELLGEIGLYANLGFHIIQRGNDLVFEVLTLSDRSDFVQLSVKNGTLVSESLEQSPPKVTRAIVAGQGEGTARQFVARTTPASEAAEAEWGRVIERFIDQRNTDVVEELEQAGDEDLLKEGFTATAIKAIPADDQTMRYAIDWNLGDTLGLITSGQSTTAAVTEAVIIANSSRVAVGAAIGDVTGFDDKEALARRVEDTRRRVANLERSIEISQEVLTVPWSAIIDKPAVLTTDPGADRLTFWDESANALSFLEVALPLSVSGTTLSVDAVTPTALAAALASLIPPGQLSPTAVAAAPAGWLLCDGQAVSRTDYAALFAAISTTYGVGNGTSTFNVPNLKGKTIVGVDPAQTEFDTRGEIGGAKTHVLTTAEMPAHIHGQNGHTWMWGSSAPVSNVYAAGANATAGATPGNNLYTGQGQPGWASTLSAGLGGAHNNLQPYMALNYLIKT